MVVWNGYTIQIIPKTKVNIILTRFTKIVNRSPSLFYLENTHFNNAVYYIHRDNQCHIDKNHTLDDKSIDLEKFSYQPTDINDLNSYNVSSSTKTSTFANSDYTLNTPVTPDSLKYLNSVDFIKNVWFTVIISLYPCVILFYIYSNYLLQKTCYLTIIFYLHCFNSYFIYPISNSILCWLWFTFFNELLLLLFSFVKVVIFKTSYLTTYMNKHVLNSY